jgi:Arc/MetJ-type ribon-helix-helix transcriptional regulator
MTRKSRSTASAVERLLEQRRLIQEWLAKLDGSAGASMPPQVVARVRNDYQARLTEVMAELARHGDAIRQALQEAQSRHAAQEERQREGRDELAEARLRKQVGELDEARFAERNSRVRRALGEIARELATSTRGARPRAHELGGRGALPGNTGADRRRRDAPAGRACRAGGGPCGDTPAGGQVGWSAP